VGQVTVVPIHTLWVRCPSAASVTSRLAGMAFVVLPRLEMVRSRQSVSIRALGRGAEIDELRYAELLVREHESDHPRTERAADAVSPSSSRANAPGRFESSPRPRPTRPPPQRIAW
jgi:hypothetical protein